MRELETEYEGRVRVVIVSGEETATRAEEIEAYELGSHGLVVLDADGVRRAHLPGHDYGRAEIVVAIETVAN